MPDRRRRDDRVAVANQAPSGEFLLPNNTDLTTTHARRLQHVDRPIDRSYAATTGIGCGLARQCAGRAIDGAAAPGGLLPLADLTVRLA
jgi:hypothetical protein